MYVKASFVVAFAVAAFCAATPCHGAGFRKDPYLLYPGNPVEMTLLWQADSAPASCSIEWGSDASYGSGQIPVTGNASQLFAHTITGLSPGSIAYYRVTLDASQREGYFRAGTPSNSESTGFYAYGDTRTNTAAYDSVCAAILRDIVSSIPERPAIAVHVGDWVQDGDSEADWDGQFFSSLAPNARMFLAHVPVMGCRGNHEGTGALFRMYWPYAFGDSAGCWYSFDHGLVHFTVIDQYVAYSDPSAQHTWLSSDLSSSAKPWKVALFHQPAWSAAGGHANDATAQAVLCPLFKANGVQVTLAGHNHYYARCEEGGIQHITAGGGGAPLHTPNMSAPNLVTASSCYSFVRFEVSGLAMKVSAFDTGGRRIDGFEITRPGIVVSPVSGLTTSEGGGQAWFTVALSTIPASDVTIGLSCSDASEAAVWPQSLSFTPSDALEPQTVTVTGLDDAETDGFVGYIAVLAPASSSDSAYDGLDPDDVSLTNEDDDGRKSRDPGCGCMPGGNAGGFGALILLLPAVLLMRFGMNRQSLLR